MEIYIASKFIQNERRNQFLTDRLRERQYQVFLPRELNVLAVTDAEKEYVANECHNAIDRSDVVIVVSPAGDSVKEELGYTVCLKRHRNKKMKIIFFDQDRVDRKLEEEVMVKPYIDQIVFDESELLAYLEGIQDAG